MENEVIVYQPDEVTRIETRFDGNTVWLTQNEIAQLFGRSVKTISRHLKEAQKEELAGLSVFSKYENTAADGKTYTVKAYNLDAVLSVGYRVKSPRGIQFRRWSNGVLAERITRQAQQNALQGRLEALERQMARLTGEALPCAPDASYAPPARLPAEELTAHRNAALVSLVTRERIRFSVGRLDDFAIFVRESTLDGWLDEFGMTAADVRNMVERGENRDFLPNFYTFAHSDGCRDQGMMFVGANVTPENCREVLVIGGAGRGTIAKRVRGRQPYGVLGRLAIARM